jgi:hypothetical protein
MSCAISLGERRLTHENLVLSCTRRDHLYRVALIREAVSLVIARAVCVSHHASLRRSSPIDVTSGEPAARLTKQAMHECGCDGPLYRASRGRGGGFDAVVTTRVLGSANGPPNLSLCPTRPCLQSWLKNSAKSPCLEGRDSSLRYLTFVRLVQTKIAN